MPTDERTIIGETMSVLLKMVYRLDPAINNFYKKNITS